MTTEKKTPEPDRQDLPQDGPTPLQYDGAGAAPAHRWRQEQDIDAHPNESDLSDIEEVLEDLRVQGLAVRLTERRDGWPVYVTRRHVNGRPADPLTLVDLAKAYSRRE